MKYNFLRLIALLVIAVPAFTNSFEKPETPDVDPQTKTLEQDFELIKKEHATTPKAPRLHFAQKPNTAQISSLYDQLKAKLHTLSNEAKRELNTKLPELINKLDQIMNEIKDEVNNLK